MEAAFSALSDPTRRRIVELLGAGEQSAGVLVGNFAISAPAVSQHLKVLRDAGLVRVRIDAQRRIYSLDPDGLAAFDAWLARIRPFWADRLGRLEQEIVREKEKQDGKAGS